MESRHQFNGQGVVHFLMIFEIWIIVIRSHNQWYHELGPGRANLFNGHSGAHNPKVLEVSIIAILLQSLQNHEFSPEKANSFNGHRMAYILKIPGILIMAILLQTLQNQNLGLVRPNTLMILENLVIATSSHRLQYHKPGPTRPTIQFFKDYIEIWAQGGCNSPICSHEASISGYSIGDTAI